MRYWLLSQGSLTAQLEAHFTKVQLSSVAEYSSFASLAQANTLGIAARSAVIVRNISLSSSTQPLIWAHSVLPLSSLVGANQQIRLQRHKPLGKILFQHPNLTRSPIQLCYSDSYWCRRSVFTINGRPVLVAEAFAQELLK